MVISIVHGEKGKKMSKARTLDMPDMVEVVRCKDCKYWYTEGQYCDRLSSTWEKEYTATNDYCSRGERKEDK